MICSAIFRARQKDTWSWVGRFSLIKTPRNSTPPFTPKDGTAQRNKKHQLN